MPWTLRVRRAASRSPLGSGSGNPGVRCVSVSCCSGGVANPLVRCASAVLPGIRCVAEREYAAMDSEEIRVFVKLRGWQETCYVVLGVVLQRVCHCLILKMTLDKNFASCGQLLPVVA